MFDRLEMIIGDRARLLCDKTVLLIGLGGVGGYVFECLVRSGVGTIIVVDGDVFDESNLNRQLLCNQNNVGFLKVDEALKRQMEINPNCNVIKINEFVTLDNVDVFFDYDIDFVIDAIDMIGVKKAIIEKAFERGVDIISVMGTGNKMHPEMLDIVDLKKTCYDPIARELRRYFNKKNIGKIMVVSSCEVPIKCGGVGSNAFVPAVAGLLAASYVINKFVMEG